jgi:hypothetical protein
VLNSERSTILFIAITIKSNGLVELISRMLGEAKVFYFKDNWQRYINHSSLFHIGIYNPNRHSFEFVRAEY